LWILVWKYAIWQPWRSGSLMVSEHRNQGDQMSLWKNVAQLIFEN
jgi:hypothetical protein